MCIFMSNVLISEICRQKDRPYYIFILINIYIYICSIYINSHIFLYVFSVVVTGGTYES